MRELSALDPASDAYRFLQTKLLRQRNRADLALREATMLADSVANG
jgi:hypothetical protein